MGKRRGGGGGHKYREKEISKALNQLQDEAAEKHTDAIKFMYRDAVVPKDVRVFTEEVQYIENPSHLIMLEKEKKGSVKVKRNMCPVDNKIALLDISVKARGPKEDQFFALDPAMLKNVRRGNTIIEYEGTEG